MYILNISVSHLLYPLCRPYLGPSSNLFQATGGFQALLGGSDELPRGTKLISKKLEAENNTLLGGDSGI